jgi:hypothetical protein
MEINADINSKQFEDKIRVFSSGLGDIFNELFKTVGKEMSDEAKAKAPVNSGRLKRGINFILDKKNNLGALTTRKNLNKSNVWYARMVEKNRTINPKNKEYLTFKINGEWKKVKSVNVKGQPFMTPVFDDYWDGNGSKGYMALSNALMKKINEELG